MNNFSEETRTKSSSKISSDCKHESGRVLGFSLGKVNSMLNYNVLPWHPILCFSISIRCCPIKQQQRLDIFFKLTRTTISRCSFLSTSNCPATGRKVFVVKSDILDETRRKIARFVRLARKQHNRHFLFNYLAICPIKYPCARALPRISISFVVVLHNKES